MSEHSPREYPFEGEMLTVSEIAKRTGLQKGTIWKRLWDGLEPDRAFSDKDLRVERMKTKCLKYTMEFRGKKVTLSELAEMTGIKRTTLATRYRNGDRGERLWRPKEHGGGRGKWYERY